MKKNKLKLCCYELVVKVKRNSRRANGVSVVNRIAMAN